MFFLYIYIYIYMCVCVCVCVCVCMRNMEIQPCTHVPTHTHIYKCTSREREKGNFLSPPSLSLFILKVFHLGLFLPPEL